jgi:NAD(P)-dependent dehydrogenase (short-subunit alcohol dehydrogenase family)
MQDEGSAMITKELFDLSGKVALITGGSRGLGSLQMAEALGDMGARVAISARKQNELDTASSYLTAKGIDVLTIVNDLGGDASSKPEETLVSTVMDRFGAVDILINNAGMVWGGVAIDLTPEN